MRKTELNAIDAQPDTLSHIKVLLAARLAIISFFMGIVVFYRVRFELAEPPFLALWPVAAAYLLTIAYAVGLNFVKNYIRFAHTQLYIDLILVTWILFATGGLNSPFSFKFALIIIASSFFRNQRVTFTLAAIASILYTAIVGLETAGVIKPYYVFPPISNTGNLYLVSMTVVLHILTFQLIAFMSSHFMGLLIKSDQKLIETSKDFTMLKAFHENVLQSMGLGLFAIDLNRVILSHNPAAERILGLPGDRINRRYVDEVIQMPNIVPYFSEMGKEDDSIKLYEWVYKNEDGRDINLSMTLSKLMVSGVTHGVIAVFQDMTDLKTMENQVANAERLAAIGRLAAAIAHEIRNPLASLSGSIQILSSDLGKKLDSRGVRLMNIITRETDRLNRIITQFLNYTAPPVIKPEETLIEPLIMETVTLLKSNPEHSGRVQFNIEIEKQLTACIDPEQVKQVLWNLCANAIDAIDNNGELTVEARTDRISLSPDDHASPTSENGDSILILIKDNGKGMDKSNLARIFEPFYTTKSNGTGLGLSTVHKIVESHKGKIDVQSTVGSGTAFYVWLPVNCGFLCHDAPVKN